MSRRTLLAAAGILFGLTLSTSFAGDALGFTQRRVSGVITAVGEASVTIKPREGQAVTARVDAAKTRVVVDGREAAPADLKPAYSARAELGLDEVWVSIVVDSRH